MLKVTEINIFIYYTDFVHNLSLIILGTYRLTGCDAKQQRRIQTLFSHNMWNVHETTLNDD